MKSYSFIVNPKAGKRNASKTLELLSGFIADRGLDARIFLTERPGHAQDLARDAPDSIVVAVGGDGTIHEVVNGIIGSSKHLGIVPNGSGNDLIKSLGIPSAFEEALQKLVDSSPRAIDGGQVRCKATEGTSERYFANGVGIGFDAAVAERTKKIRFVRGTALYVAAVFQTLGKYKSPDFTLHINSTSRTSRNLLIAIGNGRCAGGGFYLTPKAKVNDGLLDICIIDELRIPGILRIMPQVMRGAHERNPHVTMAQTKELVVESREPFVVHADGEIVALQATRVDVKSVAGTLSVIC